MYSERSTSHLLEMIAEVPQCKLQGSLPSNQPPGPPASQLSGLPRWRSICWRLHGKTEVGLKPLLYLSCFQSYLGNLIISNADVLQCSEISC